MTGGASSLENLPMQHRFLVSVSLQIAALQRSDFRTMFDVGCIGKPKSLQTRAGYGQG